MSDTSQEKLKKTIKEFDDALEDEDLSYKDNKEFFDHIKEVLENEESLRDIDDNLDCERLYYLGKYYDLVERDEKKMVNYFMNAGEKGYIISAYELGCYYSDNKNYEKMKKYLDIAVEGGSVKAMDQFASFYQRKEKNYDKMIYYLELAIEHGLTESHKKLARHYKSTKNWEKYVYHLEQYIEKGKDPYCEMLELARYFEKEEPNYTKMKTYYEKAIKIQGYRSEALQSLFNYYYKYDTPYDFDLEDDTFDECVDEMIDGLEIFLKEEHYYGFFEMLKQLFKISNCDRFIDFLLNIDLDDLKKKIKKEKCDDLEDDFKKFFNPTIRRFIKMTKNTLNTLDLHFKYAPTAEGYEEAKKDFLNYSKD